MRTPMSIMSHQAHNPAEAAMLPQQALCLVYPNGQIMVQRQCQAATLLDNQTNSPEAGTASGTARQTVPCTRRQL